MPESTVVKNMRDGKLTLRVSANTYEIKYEEGKLTLNIPGRSVAVYKDRGRFADTLHGTPSLRYDQDQEMTGSFDCYLRDISDGSYVTAPEFILHSGQYGASWGSTLGANAEVKTCDLLWDVEGSDHGDGSDHQLLLQWVVLNGAIGEGSPNRVTINFTSYDIYPTAT